MHSGIVLAGLAAPGRDTKCGARPRASGRGWCERRKTSAAGGAWVLVAAMCGRGEMGRWCGGEGWRVGL